jgi:hypothetical protein
MTGCFRAQIETYKYYQRKVELLDENFNNIKILLFKKKVINIISLLRMIKIKKYAAIDIGSNAMRLFNIVEQEERTSI